MKHVRRFTQETVREESAKAFDDAMNAIYEKASKSGKMPEVHYFDGLGLSATVRYYLEEDIPESISDEYSLKGDTHRCFECPLFKLPEDKRIKNFRCKEGGGLVSSQTQCCDHYYILLEAENDKEKKAGA